MTAINRKFYQSPRGPAPSDEDTWSLVFDPETRRLLVRHQWQTSRHDGFEDVAVAEFLKATGSAQTALIDSLFLVPAGPERIGQTPHTGPVSAVQGD